jgi:hypothetical protein
MGDSLQNRELGRRLGAHPGRVLASAKRLGLEPSGVALVDFFVVSRGLVPS